MKSRLFTSVARSRASWLRPIHNEQGKRLAVQRALLSSFSKQRSHHKSKTEPSPSATYSRTTRKHASSVTAPAASTDSTEANIPAVLVNDIRNQELLIEITPGQAARYPSFWLRDHCLCSTCSHPNTHQRQHDSFTLEPSVKAANVASSETGLEITWSDPSNHVSYFPWSWLQRHSPFTTSTANATARHREVRSWTPFLPSTPLPKTSYDSIVSSPDGLSSILTQLQTYGISFIPSSLPSPNATESLLTRIGPIRNTHYGEFWDFTSEVNPIDTAYTNLYLPLHTDNTYFTEPAGLQLFHLLSHTTADHPTNNAGDYDGTLGGESTFSDGFAAAAKLHSLNPTYYNLLSTIPIVFAAEGSPAGTFRNNHLHQSGDPIFTHHSTSSKDFHPENLTCVRWNNLDRSPLTFFPSHSVMLQWYAAAKLYYEILHSEEFMLTTALRPGEPVIFDNWRVLHGRVGFEGRRRVCGGYINADDWMGKLERMREGGRVE